MSEIISALTSRVSTVDISCNSWGFVGYPSEFIATDATFSDALLGKTINTTARSGKGISYFFAGNRKRETIF